MVRVISRWYVMEDRVSCPPPHAVVINSLARNDAQGLEYFFGTQLFNGMMNQRVSNARYSQNIGRFTWPWLQFLAQMPNVRLDQATISLITKAPDIGHNLVGRTNIVGVNCEQMKELRLSGRESNRFTVDGH